MTQKPMPSIRVAVSGAREFYQHGWQSWNVAAWRPVDTPLRYPTDDHHRLQSTDPVHLDDPFPGGSGLGAVALRNGEVMLLGALGIDSWVSFDGKALIGSGAGPWFQQQGSELSVFGAYQLQLGNVLGKRKSNPGAIWCSWYGYYRDISERRLLAALTEVSELAFSVFQIDDGWQVANGDWLGNTKFPSGMAQMATRCEQAGLVPGLWLAPFLVDPASALFSQYPQMILKDALGIPVVAANNWGPTYTLDVTRHDVLDWLAQLCQRMVADGYQYLKLDFLYAASLPGCYREEMSRETAYRHAIQVMREAVGNDVYLLGCGAPILASVGVLDGLRVGPDVASVWDDIERTLHLADRAGPGVADAITTSLGRYWLKELIDIDPDVAYFRSRNCSLTAQQKQLLVDLCHVCEFRGTSDIPRWLSDAEMTSMVNFLGGNYSVEQTERYRFSLIDNGSKNRAVDFTEVAASRPW